MAARLEKSMMFSCFQDEITTMIADQEIDSMLFHFLQDARQNDIMVALQATDLSTQIQDVRFEEILGMALEVAKRNCMQTSLSRQRMILIHSRNLQRRIFLKMRYSCIDEYLQPYDRDVMKIKDSVEKAKGYFNVELLDGAVDMKIALPIH